MIFDRPTAYELLDAVSIFLEGKIKNELPKHLGFNLQIAINVINIVKREIKSGKEIDETSSKLISDLLEHEDTMKSLAEAIKNQTLDLEDKNLQSALLEITKMKLSVDNPKYSTYKELIEWFKGFFIS